MPVIDALNVDKEGSFLAERRRLRMLAFRELMRPRSDLEILDVGGTESLWKHMNYSGRVVCLNATFNHEPTLPNVEYVQGDGRSLPFEDGRFDIVFSNSVIEHIPTPQGRQSFASEVMRVGDRYWIQTPNRYFPLEPHIFIPFFQFFPDTTKEQLTRRWPFAWYQPGDEAAVREMLEIHLLSRREMETLFPGSQVFCERVGPLTKSFCFFTPGV